MKKILLCLLVVASACGVGEQRTMSKNARRKAQRVAAALVIKETEATIAGYVDGLAAQGRQYSDEICIIYRLCELLRDKQLTLDKVFARDDYNTVYPYGNKSQVTGLAPVTVRQLLSETMPRRDCIANEALIQICGEEEFEWKQQLQSGIL